MTREQRQKIIAEAYGNSSNLGFIACIVAVMGLTTTGILQGNGSTAGACVSLVMTIFLALAINGLELNYAYREAFFNALEDFEKNGKLTKIENAMLPSQEEKKE